VHTEDEQPDRAIPDSMLALRKTEARPGAELLEIPVPHPGPGEALVEVEAASICGTDLHIFEWKEWAARRLHLPLTFGHEVAGRVVEVGLEVHHVRPGTFVSIEGPPVLRTLRPLLDRTGPHLPEHADRGRGR
jgi:D-arabinose 1-dehydrogenase-like Zn-dependent alcohol dehydrogenase